MKRPLLLTASLTINLVFLVSAVSYIFMQDARFGLNRLYHSLRGSAFLPWAPLTNSQCVFGITPATIKKAETILVGDSLTAWWDWKSLNGKMPLVNLAVGQNSLDCALYSAHQVALAEPQRIIVMLGVNDLILGKTQATIVASLVRLLSFYKHNAPKASVYVLRVLPCQTKNARHSF